MKPTSSLTSPFPFRQCLFCAVLLPVLFFLCGGAQAQDRITQNTGQVLEGKVLGISGPNLEIQMPAGKIGIPLVTITAVTMPAPAELAEAGKAMLAGDHAKALPLVQGVTAKFKGLPVAWARQAVGLEGDILVAQGKLDQAEAVYLEFKKLYPNASAAQTEINMARIAISRKDYEAAKTRLAPIAEAAQKDAVPNPALAAAYGQMFLLLGQIAEAQNDHVTALENYLRTVTIYYQDKNAAEAAQQRAAALREKDPALVLP